MYIEQFHRKLDKDEDGSLCQDEIISDLNEYNSLQEKKLDVNLDETPLSLRNLMQQWTQNPVRSWTCLQVAHWVRVTVKMPSILAQIHDKKISGPHLPIMAVDREQITRTFPGLDESHANKLMIFAFKLVISGPSDDEIPSLYDDNNQDWVAFEQIVVFFKDLDKDDDGCGCVTKTMTAVDEMDGELNDKTGKAIDTPCDEISKEHRTLSEVWEYWSRHNPVRNWTTAEMGLWLDHEGLGKYKDTFAKNKVVGLHLPRIAAHAKTSFLRELNVSKEDRKKMMISAISLVLFGQNEILVSKPNLIADFLLAVCCVVISSIAIWYGYRQRQMKNETERKFVDSERNLEQIRKQLQVLDDIEKELKIKQEEEIQKEVVEDKEGEDVDTQEQNVQASLHEESRQAIANFEASTELVKLLRFTYEKEFEFYDFKKQDIELLILKARRQHDSLRRKHGNILSALFISNTRVLDNNEVLMVDTKSRLERLTHEMQELNHRWQKIELLTQSSLIQHASSSRRHKSEYSISSSISSQLTTDSVEVSEFHYTIDPQTLASESEVSLENIQSLHEPRILENGGADFEYARTLSCPSIVYDGLESNDKRKKSIMKSLPFTNSTKKTKKTHLKTGLNSLPISNIAEGDSQ